MELVMDLVVKAVLPAVIALALTQVVKGYLDDIEPPKRRSLATKGISILVGILAAFAVAVWQDVPMVLTNIIGTIIIGIFAGVLATGGYEWFADVFKKVSPPVVNDGAGEALTE